MNNSPVIGVNLINLKPKLEKWNAVNVNLVPRLRGCVNVYSKKFKK
jgi:hypothetical protein